MTGRLSKTYLKTGQKVISLDRYTGQWVALVGVKVIAHGASLEDLMHKVYRKKNKKKPAVLLVPRKDEGPYALILFQ